MIHPVKKRDDSPIALTESVSPNISLIRATTSAHAFFAESLKRNKIETAVQLFRNLGYAVWPSYRSGLWKICDKVSGDIWEHSEADLVDSIAGAVHESQEPKEPVRLSLREIRAIREREGGLHV